MREIGINVQSEEGSWQGGKAEGREGGREEGKEADCDMKKEQWSTGRKEFKEDI